jgi:drug/metabolite transporter (DMT)-like permease
VQKSKRSYFPRIGGVGWAALEGANRASLAAVSKLLGEIAKTVSWCSLLAAFCGVVQAFHGALFLRSEPREWRPKTIKAIALYGVFALGALFNTTVGVYVYSLPGADIGASTFLRMFSIVLAAPVAWILFGERLRLHQVVGIVLFLVAGWLFVGAPWSSSILEVPRWVCLSLLISVFSAINELATSAVSRIDRACGVLEETGRARFNLWVGGATAAIGLPVCLLFTNTAAIPLTSVGLGAGLLLCIGVVAQLNWRYLAYFDQGTIVIVKKFFTMSVYFLLATLFGVVFHAESISLQKLLAVGTGVAAFLLLDAKAYSCLLALAVGRVRTRSPQPL